MTNATRNKTQGAAPRKKPGHLWRAWNPGSLARIDYLPAPERQHNPPNPTHGTCEMTVTIDWGVLPDWVQYVAQDADGEWYGYERRPVNGDTQWIASDGRCDFLPTCCHNWRDSLQRRPESK